MLNSFITNAITLSIRTCTNTYFTPQNIEFWVSDFFPSLHPIYDFDDPVWLPDFLFDNGENNLHAESTAWTSDYFTVTYTPDERWYDTITSRRLSILISLNIGSMYFLWVKDELLKRFVFNGIIFYRVMVIVNLASFSFVWVGRCRRPNAHFTHGKYRRR